MPAPSLSADEILIAEFAYLTQTAAQTNEDRSRAASFYLVTFGSFVAALTTTQFVIPDGQAQALNAGFAALFGVLALMGLTTIIKLARLRLAWFASVRAMNRLKEYYVAEMPALRPVFEFNNQALPPRFTWYSLGGLMMLEVALVGSLTLGAAAAFLLLALNLAWQVPALMGAGLFFWLQVGLYLFLLREKKPLRQRHS